MVINSMVELALNKLIESGIDFTEDPFVVSDEEAKRCFEAARHLGKRPTHIYFGPKKAAYIYWQKVYNKLHK